MSPRTGQGLSDRLRTLVLGVRSRILAWYVVLVAFTMFGLLYVEWRVLSARLGDRNIPSQNEAFFVFVVAHFPDAVAQEAAELLPVAVLVVIGALVLASLVAWAAAERMLRPGRLVTEPARDISETDLSRRITDELDRMSRMVEDLLMLAKLQRPDFLDLEPVDLRALTSELRTKASALGAWEWRIDDVGGGASWPIASV